MLGRPEDGRSEGVKEILHSFTRTIRRVAGMPDYEAYLDHLRCSHPERAVPTEREYYAEYLLSRYADGPTRCC
jgi:uncharacterized short protein YbdD (DUF466 family)